jgi:hypothetical protein
MPIDSPVDFISGAENHIAAGEAGDVGSKSGAAAACLTCKFQM